MDPLTTFLAQNGPCSNDNPDWDTGTQPCPGITDVLGIFASATPPPPETDSMTLTTFSPLNVTMIDFTTTATTLATSPPTLAPISAPSDLPSFFPTASPSTSPTAHPNEIPTFPLTSSPHSDPSLKGNETYGPIVNETSTEVTTTLSTPAFYSCIVTSSDDFAKDEQTGEEVAPNNIPLELKFDYEIHTPPEVDAGEISNILMYFEHRLGDGVAQALGLVNCPDSSTRFLADNFRKNGASKFKIPKYSLSLHNKYLRRSLLQERGKRLLGRDGATALGISSAPVDQVDQSLKECTEAVTLSKVSKCTPIFGYMTVWFKDTDVDLHRRLSKLDIDQEEAVILALVKSYIETNQTDYLTAETNDSNKLLHVSYVGNRNVSLESNEPDPGNRGLPNGSEKVAIKANDDGISQEHLGLTIAATMVIVVASLAGILFLIRHGRRKSQEQEPELHTEEGQFETLSFRQLTTEAPPSSPRQLSPNPFFHVTSICKGMFAYAISHSFSEELKSTDGAFPSTPRMERKPSLSMSSVTFNELEEMGTMTQEEQALQIAMREEIKEGNFA